MPRIVVFDEHNEAFLHWMLAQRDGLLREPLDLVHVDAHDDMEPATELAMSLYYPDGAKTSYRAYYQKLVSGSLKIGSFIRPAVLTGVVRHVYLVHPHWRKEKVRRPKWTSVCSAFGEGETLVHGLKAGAEPTAFFPDLKRFRYTKTNLEHLPRRREVLLDIDLDYFACRDSIHNEID